MYIPNEYKVEDEATFHDLIHQYPLGTLITKGGSDEVPLVANHIPFLINKDTTTGKTYLIAHLASRNEQIKQIESIKEETCLIVFQSADSYISPNWYPNKKVTHKFVPTWDFAAVHVYGKPEILRDEEFKKFMLTQLTDQEEGKRGEGLTKWKLEEAPESYTKLLMKNIVGLKIEVTKMEGKWKFEQKMSSEDIKGTIDGLTSENGERGATVATMMATVNADSL